MKKIFLYISMIMACLGLVSIFKTPLVQAVTKSVAKAVEQRIVIVPFTMNGRENHEYLKRGISQMLWSRLTWPGHVQVVPEAQIKPILTGFSGKSELDIVKKVAQKTDSRFVVTGSITCLGDAFSVDAKLFDMEEKRYLPFFEQSDRTEDLIEKIDRISAMINQEAFSRTTMTWDTMQQEKRSSENELRRKNPEYLMQNPDWQQTKKPAAWKFWKRWF